MKLVKTEDGSFTFRNEEYDQTYHSQSGALEEAFGKYVKAAGITDGMTILDYCYGLGYNTLAALACAKNLTIVGLEIDADLLKNLHLLEIADPALKDLYTELITKVAEQLPKTDFTVQIGTSSVRMLIGDARETIHRVDLAFDRIYFDPFSPKVCPQLWTQEVFAECFKRTKSGGVLTTYSYARAVREGLKSVGYTVSDGPVIGRRSPSTIATKN
jgi:tRNA U34 5-methylaminomethyl-2-thiouridine-forming methyltransferase MnmC